MLSNHDLWILFQESYGLKSQDFYFEEVITDPNLITKKGLFISIEKEKRDELLKRALYNGVVAAVWPKDEKIPGFLPNHFPVFIVPEPLPALKLILEFYLKKIEENGYDQMTNFRLFKDVNEEMKQNNPIVDEITKLTKKVSMYEEGRG